MSKGDTTAPDGRALYRKYRSTSLDEVVGQDHVTTILKRSLAKGRVAHAYLLTGPRGVGKTSIARILAHEINGLPYTHESTHLDIIEIDAASNNGVDDIRDLRDKVQIAPVSASKKVYIIDEVHMLSKAAFNALLKTLEEPPAHVVFILATTDVEKLPDTIISRTQRFNFRMVSPEHVVGHLRHIADSEGLKIDDDTLALIAERGGGSFRDSISLLDQLSSLSDDKEGITRKLAEDVLGLAPVDSIRALLQAVRSHDQSTVLQLLKDLADNGVDGGLIASQLIAAIQRAESLEPELLTLLDGLLDVAASHRPDIKLLTVLGKAAKPRSKTVATSATIPALEIKAEQPLVVAPKPVPRDTPTAAKAAPATPKAAAVAPPEATAPKPAPAPKPAGNPSGTFDWEAFSAAVRECNMALHSLLAKCKHELDGATIKLYTGNAFYKKKLDDAKYLPLLHESLQQIGATGYEIETIPTGAPLKDSQAAAVAAIMGGGEEVSLGDS